MRYAIINAGIVTDIAEWDGVAAFTPNGTLVASLVADAGDTFDGHTFTPPAPVMPTVPQSISAVAARLALSQAGLREQVEAAVKASPAAVVDWWEYSPAIERQNPFVLQLAGALGLSAAQIDALFTAGAQLAPLQE